MLLPLSLIILIFNHRYHQQGDGCHIPTDRCCHSGVRHIHRIILVEIQIQPSQDDIEPTPNDEKDISEANPYQGTPMEPGTHLLGVVAAINDGVVDDWSVSLFLLLCMHSIAHCVGMTGQFSRHMPIQDGSQFQPQCLEGKQVDRDGIEKDGELLI